MRRTVVGVALALALFSPSTGSAQDRGFGAGILVGEPTGITAKFWESRRAAIDVAASWSLADDAAFQLHADYLYHFFGDLEVERGKLPLYLGFGLRAAFRDVSGEDDVWFGLRFPVGLDFMARQAKLDVFGEVVPVLIVDPETEFDFEGGVGLRYWFR